jgi:pyruvate dehydrogenase E2 component (dihydrolipoamide acetyltransferase)
MADFVMPTLGADMIEGTLVQWKKQAGDRVTKGEIIAEVDTEKAAIEVESHATGTIERLLTQPGDKVPVGTVMAVIREDGPATSAPAAARQPARPAVIIAPEHSVSAPPVSPLQTGRLRMSPAARKLAAERGLDPAGLQGTGPDGAITLDDIERAKAIRDGAKPAEAADRQARMRQTIAAAMTRSKREIPHYNQITPIDMGLAIAVF